MPYASRPSNGTKTMARMLLDFSNLRVGGGVQVASATLQDLTNSEIQHRYHWLADATILLSSKIRQHLLFDPACLPGRVRVVDTYPNPLALLRRPTRDFDVRFTLFGPTYTGRLARREILGFAEVTMLYDPAEYDMGDQPLSVRSRVGRFVKRRLVTRADRYVTETSAIAGRLAAKYAIPRDAIVVVPNRPHPLMKPTAKPMRVGKISVDELHLLYPTRAYPHKNLAVIGPIARRYQQKTGRRLIVHTTLRPDEWAAQSEADRRWMHNHGEVSPATLAALYLHVDAVLFPSLLEASSATPLEANVIGVPLIASNRDFVTSSATAQVLFEPTDPDSVLAAILSFEENYPYHRQRAIEISASYRRILAESSRTESYLNVMTQEQAALPT